MKAKTMLKKAEKKIAKLRRKNKKLSGNRK